MEVSWKATEYHGISLVAGERPRDIDTQIVEALHCQPFHLLRHDVTWWRDEVTGGGFLDLVDVIEWFHHIIMWVMYEWVIRCHKSYEMCSIVSSSELQISPEISKNAELHLHLLNHFGHWLCCLRNRSQQISADCMKQIAEDLWPWKRPCPDHLQTSSIWHFRNFQDFWILLWLLWVEHLAATIVKVVKPLSISWNLLKFHDLVTAGWPRGVTTMTSSVRFCLYPWLQLLLTLSFCYGAHCLERTCGASLNWNRTEGKILPDIELQNATIVKIHHINHIKHLQNKIKAVSCRPLQEAGSWPANPESEYRILWYLMDLFVVAVQNFFWVRRCNLPHSGEIHLWQKDPPMGMATDNHIGPIEVATEWYKYIQIDRNTIWCEKMGFLWSAALKGYSEKIFDCFRNGFLGQIETALRLLKQRRLSVIQVV